MGRVAPAPITESSHLSKAKPPLNTSCHHVTLFGTSFSPLRGRKHGDIDEKDFSFIDQEKVISKSKRDNEEEGSYNTGRWGGSEKRLFLEGLRQYGKGRWKQIGKVVKTRSLVQIKSHGQKVLKKLETGEDIFAELDRENNEMNHGNGNKEFKESESRMLHKTRNENFPDTGLDDCKYRSLSRTAASRFSWILPSRNQPKEETDVIQSVNTVISEPFPLEKKRKGRKKESIAKIARTGLSMVSARSLSSNNSLNDNCEHESDIQQDTAVAVQALSTLFLSTPPPVSQSQTIRNDMNDNSTGDKEMSNLQHSRVEDAQILLSLTRKSSHIVDEEKNILSGENQTSTPWWCRRFS